MAGTGAPRSVALISPPSLDQRRAQPASRPGPADPPLATTEAARRPSSRWARFSRDSDPRTGTHHPAIQIDQVSKTFSTGRRALADIDLVVPDGDFVFLVGPSGAGKSTLIRLLIRDELPSHGRVIVAGQDLSRIRHRDVPRLRRAIGIVFQDFKLLPRKTVRENIAFALDVTGTPGRQARIAVDRALALVGLTDQADQRPSQLSGGEQQRTAIARAMVHDPRIVIADEPTGNLDPMISWEIIQLFQRINDLGTTVVMATHNADVVTALRKRVIALDEGRIIRDEVGGYHGGQR